MIVAAFLVQALAFGAYAHAYWGAFSTLGKAAAPMQLWRHPELRTLPALPPLPLWRAALLYAAPLALVGAIGGLFGQYAAWIREFIATLKH